MSTNNGGSVLACMPEAVDADTILEDLLPCPRSGDGVHKWLFYVGCWLREAGLTLAEAESLEADIEERMTRDQNPEARNKNPGEIVSAIRAAYGGRTSTTPRWSPPNPTEIARVEKDGPTLLEVIDRSEPTNLLQSQTDDYIDALFPGNPLLCVGTASDSFRTAPRETLRGALHLYSLIVPSPMTALRGLTKAGKRSAHCENNTGPRKYMGIEFDNGSLNQQAARLWHLARFMPLVLIVFSGSKSLHGWFVCAGRTEEKLEQFFNYACALGCDTATWGRSQFVRMPDGTRHGAGGKACEALKGAGLRCLAPRRQHVLFWNPKLIQT